MTAEPQVFGAPPPALPGGSPAAAPTVLEGLLADLQAVTDDEDVITYTVPSRPGFEVRYSTVFEYETVQARTMAAKDPAMPTGINSLTLACATLAGQCLAILKDGEDVVDGDGRPVTFQTEAFRRMLGALDAAHAVRLFYKKDGHALRASDELHRDGGYGPEGVPTKR